MTTAMQKTITAFFLCLCAMGASGAESDRFTLRTARSTFVFGRDRNGAVVSLVDNATGTEFVSGRAAEDLFALAWTRPGDTSGRLERLAGHDAEQVRWDVSDRGLTAVFERLGRRRGAHEGRGLPRAGEMGSRSRPVVIPARPSGRAVRLLLLAPGRFPLTYS